MSPQELRNHVLVVGHGRSGTNMVLDLFDQHRGTFCRNEPNELRGTALTGLGDPVFPDDAAPDFANRWVAALAQTFRRCGARDRFGVAKDHFCGPLLARAGQAVMSRARARAVLSVTAQEWPAPALYYDHTALARALPVLKLLLTPAWVNRAHDLTPQRVVHVLRAPQGFVQSWYSRYVTATGPEQVFADNQPSLARILDHFGQPPAAPAFSTQALVVSELWRWRYINEVMIDQLSDSDRYMIVPYDAVMADQSGWAARLYDFAGLTMTTACRDQIADMQNTLFAPRKAQGLDPALVDDAVARVLDGSPHRDTLLATYPL